MPKVCPACFGFIIHQVETGKYFCSDCHLVMWNVNNRKEKISRDIKAKIDPKVVVKEVVVT